jgi:ABC-type multidrug transport system fused ATPase/permease subunit
MKVRPENKQPSVGRERRILCLRVTAEFDVNCRDRPEFRVEALHFFGTQLTAVNRIELRRATQRVVRRFVRVGEQRVHADEIQPVVPGVEVPKFAMVLLTSRDPIPPPGLEIHGPSRTPSHVSLKFCAQASDCVAVNATAAANRRCLSLIPFPSYPGPRRQLPSAATPYGLNLQHLTAIGVEPIGIGKQFGSFHALSDVSLKVMPATVHGLLGENGAGKSTLVKGLLGYYRADDRSFIVEGRGPDRRDARWQGGARDACRRRRSVGDRPPHARAAFT